MCSYLFVFYFQQKKYWLHFETESRISFFKFPSSYTLPITHIAQLKTLAFARGAAHRNIADCEFFLKLAVVKNRSFIFSQISF